MAVKFPLRFVPLETFHSDEFRSDYVAGLPYQVKEDNPKRDQLLAAVQKWVQEGKVVAGEEAEALRAAGRSTMGGSGTVH